jgi:hypothetical protein
MGATTVMDRSDGPSGRAGRDRALDAPLVAIALAGAVATAVALGVAGLRAASGVALGAVIAFANLWVFARLARAFLAGDGSAGRWGVIAVLKLFALFGGFWLLIRHPIVGLVPLMLGYGVLPVGITLGGLFSARSSHGDA